LAVIGFHSIPARQSGVYSEAGTMQSLPCIAAQMGVTVLSTSIASLRVPRFGLQQGEAGLIYTRQVGEIEHLRSGHPALRSVNH
jgi:hypothetical protein